MNPNYYMLLEVYGYDKKKRLGNEMDGGYVIGLLDGGYQCYISAGISNEESFSRDFIHMYKMDQSNSFAFDGTIESYPYEYTRNISFVKKNISCLSDNEHTNLKELISKYNDIFLKMDIEGGEYPWLMSLNSEELDRFKQIVIEFHGITGNGWNCNYHTKMHCLEKLKKTHYLIHAHGNNWGSVVNGIPDVIELTYVNKSYFDSHFMTTLLQNHLPLPDTQLDFPNKPDSPEIDLNHYPFSTLR